MATTTAPDIRCPQCGSMLVKLTKSEKGVHCRKCKATTPVVSWAWYVTTQGDNGKYSTNGLRFATRAEAENWGSDLASRWFAVIAGEARPSQDEVTR